MTDDTKTLSVIGYPTGTRRERVLALANGAKQALFGGGCPMLTDDALIRAALAIDRMREGDIAETAVVGIAVMFSPEVDATHGAETRALLATPLCEPWTALAEAVANNRRILGLPEHPVESKGEAAEPECSHGVAFDERMASGLSSTEARRRWPRLDGECPLGCGYSGIYYASMAHYVCGDW